MQLILGAPPNLSTRVTKSLPLLVRKLLASLSVLWNSIAQGLHPLASLFENRPHSIHLSRGKSQLLSEPVHAFFKPLGRVSLSSSGTPASLSLLHSTIIVLKPLGLNRRSDNKCHR